MELWGIFSTDSVTRRVIPAFTIYKKFNRHIKTYLHMHTVQVNQMDISTLYMQLYIYQEFAVPLQNPALHIQLKAEWHAWYCLEIISIDVYQDSLE